MKIIWLTNSGKKILTFRDKYVYARWYDKRLNNTEYGFHTIIKQIVLEIMIASKH